MKGKRRRRALRPASWPIRAFRPASWSIRAFRPATGPTLALAAALGGCESLPAPDTPQACAFEQRTELPVTIRRNAPVIEASINGQTTHLIFDTGAEYTLLFEAAAERLKLRPDWAHMTASTGLSGQAVHFNAIADTFAFQGTVLRDRTLTVGSTTMPDTGSLADGVVGLDVIRAFDADIDLPRRRITLYRWRDCPGGKPDWDFAYATLPVEVAAATHYRLFVPGSLNATPVSVMIDTGAAAPVVSLRTALRAGITGDALLAERTIAINGIGSAAGTAYLHRFDALSIGGEKFTDPVFPVVDLPESSGDMLMGYTWMRSRRLWLSIASRRLYLARPSPNPAPRQ